MCDAPPSSGEPRQRPEPLTLAGSNLVFCSHTGVVVAVDVRTGKPAWAFRYPKSARPTVSASPRDLCPPLADAGRVFVAPADADRVYAVDADTGRELWAAGPTQVEQLLGVVRGRLICTVTEPTRGVRGLSVATGSHREPEGWACHDDPGLRSFGRGLVTGDKLLWPTPAGVFFLNPTDGTRLPAFLPHPHGNLAFADGILLVATPTELWGYVAPRHDLPERRKTAALHPASSTAADRLAEALADARKWDEADTRPEFLADRAERALIAGKPDVARDLLRHGLNAENAVAWRTRAAGRLLTLEPSGGGVAAMAKFFDRLNLPDDSANDWLTGPHGLPTRLRDLATRHFVAPDPRPPPMTESPSPTAIPPAFDLVAHHRLGADVRIVHETRFPTLGTFPLLPIAGATGLPGLAEASPRLLVTDGNHLFAYRPESDRPEWVAPLPAGLTVTHAAIWGERDRGGGAARGGAAAARHRANGVDLPTPRHRSAPRRPATARSIIGLGHLAAVAVKLRTGRSAIDRPRRRPSLTRPRPAVRPGGVGARLVRAVAVLAVPVPECSPVRRPVLRRRADCYCSFIDRPTLDDRRRDGAGEPHRPVGFGRLGRPPRRARSRPGGGRRRPGVGASVRAVTRSGELVERPGRGNEPSPAARRNSGHSPRG